MKKAAFLMAMLMVLQPTLAEPALRWYDDPVVWAVSGLGVFTAYMFGGRLKEGMSRVLPAMIASTVTWGTAGLMAVSMKLNRQWVTTGMSFVVLLSFLVYKAMRTCPRTGQQGCCCGMTPQT